MADIFGRGAAMPRIMSGMSIREMMANMWGAVKRSANRVSSVATAPFRRPAGRDPLNMSVVFRGVQILQTAVSGLPVRQLRHGMAVEPARIVERPDPDTWRADFISETVMGLALNGNAFWLRLKGVDGSTIGLRNLPPALVSVSDARGDIANPDKRYGYMGREYTSNDIIHLRFLKVPGRLRGMGPIEAAREEIEGAIDARDYKSRYFSEGTHPTGIISTAKPLNDEVAEKVKESFKRNVDDVKVLTGDLKYTQLALSPKDMQFLETQQFDTTQAYAQPIELALGEVLPRGTSVELDWDSMRRSDTKTKAETYQILIACNVLTVDEARAMEGRPPLPAAPTPQPSNDLEETE